MLNFIGTACRMQETVCFGLCVCFWYYTSDNWVSIALHFLVFLFPSILILHTLGIPPRWYIFYRRIRVPFIFLQTMPQKILKEAPTNKTTRLGAKGCQFVQNTSSNRAMITRLICAFSIISISMLTRKIC